MRGDFLRLAAFLLVGFVVGCGDRSETGLRPERPLEALLSEIAGELDPETPGLKEFFEAWEAGEVEAARGSLLGYFRSREIPRSVLPEPLEVEQALLVGALDAWRGTFTFQGVRGQAADPDGLIDWEYKGPKDDSEWAWFLHRHAFLREMQVLYEVQGHDEFAERIGQYLVDWYWRYPPPDRRSFSASWRALEASRRYVDSWLPVYDSLKGDPAFGEEAELAVIAGAARHANYLQSYHHFGGNHLVTEMMGLASIAVAWPEFQQSEEWLDYALGRALEELEQQVYPDGAHKELANHYQWIAGTSFQRLYEILLEAEAAEAVAQMEPWMEKIWDYYAGVVRPDGTGPLNNDSDLEPNAAQLLGLAELYERPDWLFVATDGAEGKEPLIGPSREYPWAGQAVLRTEWGSRGDWVFFDAGPLGSDHQQRDRLHLSASLAGRDFLVDSGRYVYRDDEWAAYFRGPRAHNMPTFSQYERVSSDAVARVPMVDFTDYEGPLPSAWGSIPLRLKGLPGWTGSHARKVSLGRGFVWIVDKVSLGRPDEATFRWHFHPELSLEGEGRQWSILDGEELVGQWFVAGTTSVAAAVVRGSEVGRIQGWYSSEYNRRLPNAVLEFNTAPTSVGVFAWLLVSQEAQLGEIELSVNPDGSRLQFERDGRVETHELSFD